VPPLPIGMMPGMVPMAYAVHGGNQGAYALPAQQNPLLQKWRPQLDAKAVDALMALSPQDSSHVLQELESKGMSVRNPSAYVQKACENAKDGHTAMAAGGNMMVGAYVGASTGAFGGGGSAPGGHGGGYPGAPPMGANAYVGGYEQQAMPGGYGFGCGDGFAGQAAGTDVLARYAGKLDADATKVRVIERAKKCAEALERVGEGQAAIILQNLQARGVSVRNPSAYVCRSVANAKGVEGGDLGEGHRMQPPPAAHVPPPPPPSMGGRAPGYTDVIGEAGLRADVHSLDEKARQALEEIGPEAADAILQVLDSQRAKVQNPSAYVLKAVGNARKGKGAGGVAASTSAPYAEVGFSGADVIGHWRSSLDSRALMALEALPHEEQARIVAELESKSSSVRNPSAYVIRATTNAKNGNFPGSAPPAPAQSVAAMHMMGAGVGYMDCTRNGGPPPPAPPMAAPYGDSMGSSAELSAAIAALPVPLDEKAKNALHEVGPSSGLHILQVMSKQQVGNPSAYIMKAVSNERRVIQEAESQAKKKRLV